MITSGNKEAYKSKRSTTESGNEKIKKLIAAAQEYERQRISRELHDELGQYVSTLRFGLESILSSLPANATETEKLTHLFSIVDKLDKEVDYFANTLRSPVEDEGLKEIMSSFIADWEQRCGVPVKMIFSGSDDDLVDYDIKNALYRVMQEALTNIMKHAGASRVGVYLHIAGSRATLVVEDDGCGFDVKKSRPFSNDGHHLGLIGMRERVETVGGSLSIESIPGMGSVISVIIPIPVN